MILSFLLSMFLAALPAGPGEQDDVLDHVSEPWTGDLDGMTKRGFLRILTVHNWLMIAAQAYQESRFDQTKRSDAGAVGIMQLLPTTASDPAVGIPDVSSAEDNIHAGVRYLRWLRDEYFSAEEIKPLDRVLFSFAAYNAGPGNMARARKRATQLGFDSNRWFGNVEIGMYRAVSGEPASYVRNIYKYYVTYRRLEETHAERMEAREDAD